MNTWVNGRVGTRIHHEDRGLQYGDGLFETMRVRRGRIRLLEYHLDRLYAGLRRLRMTGPARSMVRRELMRAAALRDQAVLKLIVTRGGGPRGYRPLGCGPCTRILALHPLPRSVAADECLPMRVRLCATPLGLNPRLAGLKTLNRLESVVARGEWRDARIWEGLMRDVDENIVCGTMSNVFLRSGSLLATPPLDRCGVAGVMRRFILETAGELGLRVVERRMQWRDLGAAEEVFMSNAVVGVRSVGRIEHGRERLRYAAFDTASRLRARLERR